MTDNKKITRRFDVCSTCENYVNITSDLVSLKKQKFKATMVYCKKEIFQKDDNASKKDRVYENINEFLKKPVSINCCRKFENWLFDENKNTEKAYENIASV